MIKYTKLELICYRLIPNFILRKVLKYFSKFSFFEKTKQTQTPITFDVWYNQMVKGHCRSAYWPVHFTSTVRNPLNVYCGIDVSPGYSPGNYIQALGRITIGDYTQIGPNVGIISANHDIYDIEKYIIGEVNIGAYCWLGFGSTVLPNVNLGDFTIVAAGAVVTKSFENGYCIIAGNPAKIIKKLDVDSCIRFKSEQEFHGYIPKNKFERFKDTYLKK